MTLTAEELVEAREAANTILEELKLDAYLFEVEPQNAHYLLNVECACEKDGGWIATTLTIPKEQMISGFTNLEVRHQLFEYWNKKLAACKRQKN